MNKVLIICSNFLPVRNGGTIRCEKLAKYLPEYGWETIVLTKKPLKGTKLDFTYSLEHCKIYRTKNLDFASAIINFKVKFKGFFNQFPVLRKKATNRSALSVETESRVKRRFTEYFLVPDSDIFWALGSIVKSIYIVKKEKPKVILSSGPSHSVHIVALFLKLLLNKRWIIEFRDPWTMNPFNIKKPYKLLAFIDNYLEKIALKHADRINVTSEEYKNQFLNKYRFLSKEKIVYIPNGYDPDDFNQKTFHKNSKFTIVHTGNFYQHRSSAVFIEAILYLFKNDLLDPKDILVKFIGLLDQKGLDIITDSEFNNSFQVTGQVTHAKSINEINNADLLLLIPGPGKGTMPGKLYEYLAASKPIFCIAKEGPAKEVIVEYQLGIVVNDIDTIQIANKLNFLIESISQGNFFYPNTDEIKLKFNREKIAEQMAGIFLH